MYKSLCIHQPSRFWLPTVYNLNLFALDRTSDQHNFTCTDIVHSTQYTHTHNGMYFFDLYMEWTECVYFGFMGT